ncbi:MAG: hypothetical protein V7707_05120 [Motiliproteus sp.]
MTPTKSQSGINSDVEQVAYVPVRASRRCLCGCDINHAISTVTEPARFYQRGESRAIEMTRFGRL